MEYIGYIATTGINRMSYHLWNSGSQNIFTSKVMVYNYYMNDRTL